MAENTSDAIKHTYIAEIPRKNLNDLGNIRHWKNLQIASDEDKLWLKGFSKEQALSNEIKIIPNLELFELKNQLLFRPNRTVPTKKITSGLLWNKLNISFPISLPKENLKFEQELDKIHIQLVPTETETQSTVLKIKLELLDQFISEIPEFKLQKIFWTIIDDDVLLVGLPMLSFPGETFWIKGSHFIPSGFDFKFPILSTAITHQLNPKNEFYIYWDKNHRFIKIKKENFKELSVSSFRLTKQLL